MALRAPGLMAGPRGGNFTCGRVSRAPWRLGLYRLLAMAKSGADALPPAGPRVHASTPCVVSADPLAPSRSDLNGVRLSSPYILQVVYEVKRAENYYREQNKWDKMSSAQRQEEARLARLRDTGTGARRNKSGTEYNILTLDYNKSPGGQALSARVSF